MSSSISFKPVHSCLSSLRNELKNEKTPPVDLRIDIRVQAAAGSSLNLNQTTFHYSLPSEAVLRIKSEALHREDHWVDKR